MTLVVTNAYMDGPSACGRVAYLYLGQCWRFATPAD